MAVSDGNALAHLKKVNLSCFVLKFEAISCL